MATKKNKVKKKAVKKKTPGKKSATKKKTPVKKKTAKKKSLRKKSATKKKTPVKKKISKTAPKKTATKKTKQNPTAKKKSPPKKSKIQALPKLGPETLKIRERLLAKRSELLNLIQASKSLERDVGDLTFSNEIDLASSLEGREMIFQLTSRDRNELRLIEDALFRINDGTYGACESCEKKISLKRLQIMPLTTLCIDCQEAAENL